MNIREQLIRDEGCRLKPYKDTVGKLTIGIGRNLDDVGISIQEAHYLLDNDIEHAKNNCTANIQFFKNLDDARQGVLVNMCFNMGIGKLLHFPRMLGAMERGDWNAAADEMLNSKYASDVGDRAKRLAEQMKTGQWT
jgi:lysozyme